MKKRYVVMLLVVAFVVGMMAGVGGFGWADTSGKVIAPYGVLLNSRYSLNFDSAMINDRIYVPMDDVCDKLGYSIVWEDTGKYLFATIDAEIKSPLIAGDNHFKEVVSQGMDMLKQKDPPSYLLVCQNVTDIDIDLQYKAIKEDFFVYAHNQGGKYIRFTKNYVDSKKFTPEYVAAILSHEATHTSYFMTQEELGDKTRDERIAYEHELTTLKLINAPPWITKEVQEAYKQVTSN